MSEDQQVPESLSTTFVPSNVTGKTDIVLTTVSVGIGYADSALREELKELEDQLIAKKSEELVARIARIKDFMAPFCIEGKR